MSTRSISTHLGDILDCIIAIRDHLHGVTFATYQADRKTRRAVERELQILTEAVFRLGSSVAKLDQSIEWHNLRGMGNFIRHEYDGVDDSILWDAIHTQLPRIEIAVADALMRLQKEQTST